MNKYIEIIKHVILPCLRLSFHPTRRYFFLLKILYVIDIKEDHFKNSKKISIICGLKIFVVFFLNEANIFIFFYFFLKVNTLEFRQDVAQKDTNSKVESPPDKVDKMSKP